MIRFNCFFAVSFVFLPSLVLPILIGLTFLPTADCEAQVNHVSGVVDVLQIGDGQRIALRRQQGWFSPADSDLKSFRSGSIYHRALFPGRPTTFERLYPDPGHPNAFFLVARYHANDPESRFIYRIVDRQMEWGAITQEFDDANYYQTEKGEIFIYSRDGIIVRCFEGQLDHYHIKLNDSLAEKKGKLREIKCVDSGKGPVAFYSIVDPAFERKALTDLVVYDDGWKTISLEGRRTGPAFFVEPNLVRMIGPDKIMTIDLDSESITEVANPPLQIDGQSIELRPVDVLVDPQGQPLIMLRNFYRSRWRYDVDSFDGGKFLLGATLEPSGESFKWRPLEATFDYELYRSRHAKVDSHGNWWVIGSGAIWRRTPDGEWSEYGFRYGVNPPLYTNLIRIDDLNRLWMLNTNVTYSRAQVVDLDMLTSDKPEKLSDRWQRNWQQTPLQQNSEGLMYSLDRQNKLTIWGPDQIHSIALPVAADRNEADTDVRFDARHDKLHVRTDGQAIQAWWIRKDSAYVYQSNGQGDEVRQQDSGWTPIALQQALADANLDSEASDEVEVVATEPGRCPISKSAERFRLGTPVRAVWSTSRVAVASPDGNWHTHSLNNKILRRELIRDIRADNFGRLFFENGAYYKPKASVTWYQPQSVSARMITEALGSMTAANQKLAPAWKILGEDGQEITPTGEESLYQWRVDRGPWSRWLTFSEQPIVYALPKMGEHQLEIRLNYPGLFIENETLTYSFETSYDSSEIIDPLLKDLNSDSFEARKFAARKLAQFGIGVVPALQEIVETGPPEAKVNASRVIEAILSEASNDNQHNDPDD